MNEMNYRFNNPGVSIDVDTKIAECFIKKPRTEEEIERFKLYASMSKEYSKIEKILENIIVKKFEVENTLKKVA